jgi:hypothetical protein
MAKLGRKAIYGDTCAQPGCTEPRHVLRSPEKNGQRLWRSRLCDRHYREDMAARYAARKTEQPTPATTPTGYTVAEAYKLWETNGMPPTFLYKRRQVYGIRACAAGYTLVLAGVDAAQWVDGDERLKVSK